MNFSMKMFFKKMLRRCLKLKVSSVLSDRLYLKLYAFSRDFKLDIEHPKTYNEKLQWLKLYNRKDEYTRMVDKYEAKGYIADKVGSEYVVPLLGVWDNPDDIDFEKLPDRFVLKCNHNSGLGMVICTEKSALDINGVKKLLRKGLKENYYHHNREWPYKNVKRKIIAEEYLQNESDECLTDYKFFCFNGEPKFMYRSMDNAREPYTDFFDMDYNKLDMRMRDPNSKIHLSRPENFERMKQLARILSEGIPHVRVDFYEVEGKVYIGELTFFHCGGFAKIYPEEWMNILGDWIKLPPKVK